MGSKGKEKGNLLAVSWDMTVKKISNAIRQHQRLPRRLKPDENTEAEKNQTSPTGKSQQKRTKTMPSVRKIVAQVKQEQKATLDLQRIHYRTSMPHERPMLVGKKSW